MLLFKSSISQIVFPVIALIFQEMEWLNTKLPSTILHRDLFFKHLKSKFSHTINHYGTYLPQL